MGWIGPVLTGVSALAGLFGGKKQQNATVDKTVNPVYDDKQLSMRNYLMDAFTNNLQNDQGFGDAYKTTGLSNIANTYARSSNAVGDILSSRGIGRTTAGANALTDTTYRAGGAISNFLNNLPIVLDQRRQGLLQNAGNFFSSLPTGSHTTGYDNTSQTTGGGASGLIGGGASGLAAWLGALQAQNTLGKLLKGSGIQLPGSTPSAPSYGGSDEGDYGFQ